MGMTISQKILAAHAGRNTLTSGDIISIKLDLILGNDASAPLAIKKLRKIGMPPLKAADKIAMFPDHFTPATDSSTAEAIKSLRDFSLEAKIGHWYEVGEMGIEHAVLPEQGLVRPGAMIMGADSHTCTYGGLGAFSTGVGSTDLAAAMVEGKNWLRVPPTLRIAYQGWPGEWTGGKDIILYTIGQIGTDGGLGKTLEFCGPVIQSLDVEHRLTMTNMAVEAGAVNGIIEPDEIVRNWLKGRGQNGQDVYYKSDPEAEYEERLELNLSGLGPQVAFPHSPGNVKSVEQAAGIKLNQVFIGSCTNARLGDLRLAASVLKGRKAAPHIRLFISPASRAVYQQAYEEGVIDIFYQAGAVLLPAVCGCCFGHLGRMAKGEKCLATSNRNFRGRMGDPDSEIYLANPAVAAASAVAGEIIHPAKVV